MSALRVDVAVIGAGFGGLAAALRLSERGAKVAVLEALSYPGGCASTFARGGYSFESGATLSSGLGPGQLFRTWIDRYGLDVVVEDLDPVVELRFPSRRIVVRSDRGRFYESFLEMPGAPVSALSAFFERQGRIAGLLWDLFERSDLLPPRGVRPVLDLARRVPAYLRIAPLIGRTLGSVLRQHGLEGYQPLRVYLDSVCQITTQCPADESEALFAFGAMDYFFRGTKHLRGGVGVLAWGLTRAIRELGGDVQLTNAVVRLSREGDLWRVHARRGDVVAPVVVANVLPQNLQELASLPRGTLPSLDRLARGVEEGWGAAMLYRVVRAPAGIEGRASHLALVRDPDAPFIEGNHVFCSIRGTEGGGAPYRTLTVSTHVRPIDVPSASGDDRTVYLAGVQRRMRDTLRALAPEWDDAVEVEHTASPRTFERFTGRFRGYVGGIPRRAGLHNYRGLRSRAILPGLYLVGDTMFPGQSMLASATGGVKLADSLPI